ncbi:MAG: DUF1292 domain-containing protein [Firmicutes bacterium]|nr:DUF1292 domain-containing protein [Bacillota bacterium]
MKEGGSTLTEDQNHGDVVVLIDEDGTEHEFSVLEYLEIEEQVYVVLLPEENPEEGAFVFRVEVDDDGEEVLTDIEDDDEFDRVVNVLESEELEQ